MADLPFVPRARSHVRPRVVVAALALCLTGASAVAIEASDARVGGTGPPSTAARGGPEHDVASGTRRRPTPATPDEIGSFDDRRPVPAGLPLTAPPAPRASTNGPAGPGGLAARPGCAHQCITRGVAYPRGFGAELIVETSVPATLFMTVVADLDGNGDYEDLHVETTPHPVTSHSWALDHLEPGMTYYGMVAATDEYDHTAYAWGQFTTLSKRDVSVEVGNGEIVGGPGSISSTHWWLALDGPPTIVEPGDQTAGWYPSAPRHVDLEVWVERNWNGELCEAWNPNGEPSHGHDSGACVAWNSTSLDDIDLDVVPAGHSHWTQSTVSLSVHPPTGEGDPLPPGYGDPYYFFFEIPVVLHVTYST